jgi:IMP cyclohydrolase
MLYVGRIVCIALSKDGRLCAGYRVSSRSFPNRRAVAREGAVSIIPKPGHESDVEKNPYIAYNCAHVVCGGKVAVVTNGGQTDPVAQMIDGGTPVRDALAFVLSTLDYEHDQYNTPRICAVADARSNAGWLAVVREDGLHVRRMPLSPGTHFYVATYEENDPRDAHSGNFVPTTAEAACAFLLRGGVFAERANPVTAVAAFASDSGFALAIEDMPAPDSTSST